MRYSFTLRHLANETLPYIQKAYSEQQLEIEEKEKKLSFFSQMRSDDAMTPERRKDLDYALSLDEESIAADKARLRLLSHICTALERLDLSIQEGIIDNSVLISADDLSDSP